MICTGGFEWNKKLVNSFLRGPMTEPVGIQTNTGDALKMSMRIGAGLSNMREAWWIPVGLVPEEANSMGKTSFSRWPCN